LKERVPHSYGKRYKKSKKTNNIKVFGIICIIIFIIISIVSYSMRKKDSPNSITEDNAMSTADVQEVVKNKNNISDNNVSENRSKDQAEEQPKETIGSDLPEKMGGYKVIGELVIDKIDVKNYILLAGADDTNALDIKYAVTKFYGDVDINHNGLIALSGHNYVTQLKRLPELNKGDKFYLINKEEATKQEYEIFDKYYCKPSDLECLDPRTNGQKEVTIVTCNPLGTQRLICRAKAI